MKDERKLRRRIQDSADIAALVQGVIGDYTIGGTRQARAEAMIDVCDSAGVHPPASLIDLVIVDEPKETLDEHEDVIQNAVAQVNEILAPLALEAKCTEECTGVWPAEEEGEGVTRLRGVPMPKNNGRPVVVFETKHRGKAAFMLLWHYS